MTEKAGNNPKESLRIVTWNCRGGFHEKYKYIEKLDADIYIIQECANPEISKNKGYREFSQGCLWKHITVEGLKKTKDWEYS